MTQATALIAKLARLLRDGEEFIELSNKALGDELIALLCRALPSMPKVQTLYLSSCSLSDDGIRMLADALPLSNVRYLNIARNGSVGVDGISALADVLPATRLCSLNVSGCPLANQGILALVRNLPSARTLETLNLESTLLDDIALLALGEALQRSRLTSLAVRGNALSPLALSHFAITLPQTCLINFLFATHDQADAPASDVLEHIAVATRWNYATITQAWQPTVHASFPAPIRLLIRTVLIIATTERCRAQAGLRIMPFVALRQVFRALAALPLFSLEAETTSAVAHGAI